MLRGIVKEIYYLEKDMLLHFSYMFTGKNKMIWLSQEKPVVFLLHGYLQGDAAFSDMMRYLSDRGINVESEPYPFWMDLRDVEEILYKKIRSIGRTTENIYLIGHSLGGLVARAVVSKFKEIRKYVKKVITMGSPHRGTYAAIAGILTPSGRQMLPWSSYLKELNSIPLPKEVKFYSIYSRNDLLVLPWKNAFLKGAKNIELEGVGHIGLIMEEKIHRLLYEIITGKM